MDKITKLHHLRKATASIKIIDISSKDHQSTVPADSTPTAEEKAAFVQRVPATQTPSSETIYFVDINTVFSSATTTIDNLSSK